MKFAHGEDVGRMNSTGNPEDDHVFRVPTLRNLPLTAPYFSDGSVATLEQVIPLMAEVQLDTELSSEETAALIAFLGSMVGDQPQVVIPILPPE